ncbi:MAG: hypothetical protein ACXWN9_15695, partial [Candidatus Binataceae bacterium]
MTNSNLIATADPPILGIAFLLHRGVNDQSDQVLTISPVHTTLRERRPDATRTEGEGFVAFQNRSIELQNLT